MQDSMSGKAARLCSFTLTLRTQEIQPFDVFASPSSDLGMLLANSYQLIISSAFLAEVDDFLLRNWNQFLLRFQISRRFWKYGREKITYSLETEPLV